MNPPLVCTVGHGDRPLDEFVALLRQAGVTLLVDVRRFPGSRRHPHFARASLEQVLPAAGIAYRFEGERLGGRRREQPDSPHTALRSASFRAYADHMHSAAFRAALADLLTAAASDRPAVMCAERLPWRCHRWFIADALLVAGARVVHLLGPGSERAHTLSPFARVAEGELIYDREPSGQLELGI
jgi:uncharacterized protein (DUF488 family)